MARQIHVISTKSSLGARIWSIWKGQRRREGVSYSFDEFAVWWLAQYRSRRWKRPRVARLDHAKPYSFENIEMQEQAENNRERNARRGNPVKKKAVIAISASKRRRFATMQEAAAFYGVDRKSVYNQCTGRVAAPRNGVVFKWA